MSLSQGDETSHWHAYDMKPPDFQSLSMSQNTAVSRRARGAPSLRMITAVEMSWLTPMTRGELTWSWNHVLCEDDGWVFFLYTAYTDVGL